MRVKKISKVSTVLLLVLVGGLISIPFWGSTFLLSLLLVVFMNVTFAESWNIIGGFTGLISFGHMVFFGVGAYTGAMLLRDFGLSPFITAPFGGLTAMLLAVATGLPCTRVRGFYFAIVTSSLNEVVRLVVTILPWTGGASGIVLPSLAFDPKTTVSIFYFAMFIVMITTIFVAYRLSRSKIGVGLMAIREDEPAARSTGVAAGKLKLLSMAIGSFFPGAAGCLYSYYMTYIDPATVFNLVLSFQAIMMVLLGGTGTILGPVVGACLFTVTSELFRYTIVFEALHAIAFGILLVFIVLFIPEGIVGWLNRKFKSRLFI
ncbi:MAG: branched-chain amino acid ABC transporter permease [Candidatus Bathyarchaeia archaeon]